MSQERHTDFPRSATVDDRALSPGPGRCLASYPTPASDIDISSPRQMAATHPLATFQHANNAARRHRCNGAPRVAGLRCRNCLDQPCASQSMAALDRTMVVLASVTSRLTHRFHCRAPPHGRSLHPGACCRVLAGRTKAEVVIPAERETRIPWLGSNGRSYCSMATIGIPRPSHR